MTGDDLIQTFSFGSFVVGLAYELFVVHQIELIAGLKFQLAHFTHKTLEMIDVIVRFSNGLRW